MQKKMGLKRFVLFASIIIFQIVIIALLLISEQIENGFLSTDIMAVVAKDNKKYLLYEINDESGVIDISNTVKHLNFSKGKIYLYNENKQPIETLSYNPENVSFSKSNATPLIYTQNDFSCFVNTCVVKDTHSNLNLAKAFKANDEYIYLDAVIF